MLFKPERLWYKVMESPGCPILLITLMNGDGEMEYVTF